MFLLIQGFFSVSCFSSEDEYKRLGGSSTTQICAQKNIYLFLLLLNDLIDNTATFSYVVNRHNLPCSQSSQNLLKNIWEGDKTSFIFKWNLKQLSFSPLFFLKKFIKQCFYFGCASTEWQFLQCLHRNWWNNLLPVSGGFAHVDSHELSVI